MNQLPCEILIDIFSQLVFKDKLQCALTCRDWYNKISCTVLYSKIRIKYGQSCLREEPKIKSMYNEGLGLQVHNIYMDAIDDPLELAKFCPNLRSFETSYFKGDNWNDNDNVTLVQNWKKLAVIKEHTTEYSLTMKLLDSPLNITSLTSLTVSFYGLAKQKLPTFFTQLKHAPALEHLRLNDPYYITYKSLDLIHGNAPTLKHLELINAYYLFVEEGDDLEEYYPLSMDSSFAGNLRSISVTLVGQEEKRPHANEINHMYWIEYMCRKYSNLTSIAFPKFALLQQQQDIISDYLKIAFCNWTQLEKFDMPSIYLNSHIIRAMDDCNIRLKELKVYLYDVADMKQFANLAHSKQKRNIQKLTIVDKTRNYTKQDYLIYFFQSLSNSNCQLQDINIGVYDHPADNDNMLTLIKVLDYAPLLQSLTMGWIVTKEIAHTTHNQETHLTDLSLSVICQPDENPKLVRHSILQHIQNIIYCSPLLQSFSTTYGSETLDFQQNSKLKYLYCLSYDVNNITIIQNNQTKCLSQIDPRKFTLKESHSKNNSSRCITLHLAPNIRRLFINYREYLL